ncbi:AraC family transcriptional regulator [Nocardia stercoris]|uniref:AraC family transcriptional regulator n=1 Tax=Nocardia stercoris TaxID=2483361 RepID=A0A3M2LCN8_9NOCA|nr:AraC family transcriptional regulator [Nocardia stercoris]RMI34343.1 AraC family transcriptional regulator [Nocardia stercoris]
MNELNHWRSRAPDLEAATIPPVVILGLVEAAQRHSVDTEPWFTGTAVTPGRLTLPETRLSYRQVAVIVKRALRALPDGPLGIAVGSRDAVVSWGLLGFACRASATAADALDVAMSLHQASGSVLDYHLEHGPEQFAVRLEMRSPDPELLPFLCEEGASSIVTLLRAVFGAGASPAGLEFAYPRPAHAGAYDRYFRCPVTFAAAQTRVVFDRELLSRPLPTWNPAQLTMALDAVKHLARPATLRPDIVTAVEDVLREHLRRPVTVAVVAGRLGIGERTLQRRLTRAGVRFGDLRDRLRQQHATTLLRDSSLPIGAIAGEVGFSDTREFRRAYLRWTGRTPSAQRAAAT